MKQYPVSRFLSDSQVDGVVLVIRVGKTKIGVAKQAVEQLRRANAMILGNYLTTPGRTPEEDLRMLDDLEMPVRTDVN